MRCSPFFFFNDTATTEIYTLSLHDALPISLIRTMRSPDARVASACAPGGSLLTTTESTCVVLSSGLPTVAARPVRSEEHTSELQSRLHLVCRLLLEKKKQQTHHRRIPWFHT